MNWEKITTVNITTASGEPDTIHFETNNDGGFRIVNDYGNESITFDMMTGLNMMDRFVYAMNAYAEKEIEESSKDMSKESDDFYPDSNDCQGEGA